MVINVRSLHSKSCHYSYMCFGDQMNVYINMIKDMPIKIGNKKVSYKVISMYEFRHFVTFSISILVDKLSIILRN